MSGKCRGFEVPRPTSFSGSRQTYFSTNCRLRLLSTWSILHDLANIDKIKGSGGVLLVVEPTCLSLFPFCPRFWASAVLLPDRGCTGIDDPSGVNELCTRSCRGASPAPLLLTLSSTACLHPFVRFENDNRGYGLGIEYPDYHRWYLRVLPRRCS